MSALPVSASLQPAHSHNAALNQSALPEKGRWSHFDTFSWEKKKKKECGFLGSFYFSNFHPLVLPSANSNTAALPVSSLNRPAVGISMCTQGPLRQEGRTGWLNHAPTHTKWGGSLPGAAVQHPPECRVHSPAEYFSNLVKILHVLLVEHSHAGCLHWRGLSPRFAPRRTFFLPLTQVQNLLTQKRCSRWFRTGVIKMFTACSSLLVGIPTPWLLPTFTTERS